jgi:RNA polymerase sigma-70 factor (ECF subfamily)
MTAIQFNNRVISMQDKLMNYAKSLTYNEEDARDLLQDSILRALTFRAKFADNTNFNAWMHVIMRNIFINDYRKKTKTVKKDVSMDEVPFLASFHHTWETPEMHHAASDIRKNIDKLDADLKVPFEMHMEGYKYKEIADKLHLPIGTVKSRIFFSRKKLQKAVSL